MKRQIHLTIAPTLDSSWGCIERASYVEQGEEKEGAGQSPQPARVAFRILGDDNWTSHGWMVSCRTPRELGYTCALSSIGDGSDEAMIAWLDEGEKLRKAKR